MERGGLSFRVIGTVPTKHPWFPDKEKDEKVSSDDRNGQPADQILLVEEHENHAHDKGNKECQKARPKPQRVPEIPMALQFTGDLTVSADLLVFPDADVVGIFTLFFFC